MATLSVTLQQGAHTCQFDQVLGAAGNVASDMILVTTRFADGLFVKTVKTECETAFEVLQAWSQEGVCHA